MPPRRSRLPRVATVREEPAQPSARLGSDETAGYSAHDLTGTGCFWHEDQGWGVIDSESPRGGCWAHFSSVLVTGYRALQPGQAIR
jgi:cold shock CspA family protein